MHSSEITEISPEFDSPEVQKAIQILLKGTKLERRLFLGVYILLLGLMMAVPSHSHSLSNLMFYIISGFFFVGSSLASFVVRRKRVHEAYNLLMKVNDVRVIPVFNKIKRLKIGFYPVEIEKRLIYLYSFLTAIDVNLISEQEKRGCALEVINLVHQAHDKYENAPKNEAVIEEIRWRVRLLALAGGEKEYRQIVNLETARMGNGTPRGNP